MIYSCVHWVAGNTQLQIAVGAGNHISDVEIKLALKVQYMSMFVAFLNLQRRKCDMEQNFRKDSKVKESKR